MCFRDLRFWDVCFGVRVLILRLLGFMIQGLKLLSPKLTDSKSRTPRAEITKKFRV